MATNNVIVQTREQKLNNSENSENIEYCTSFHQLCPRLHFPNLITPKDLIIALKNNLKVTNETTQKTKNYIEFLQNLCQIKEVEQEHYLFLFKILLFVEDHARRTEMKKHNLQKHDIKQNMHDKTKFDISIPTLNIDDPFLKMEDKVLIEEVKENTTKRGIRSVANIIQISKKNLIVRVREKFAKKYNKDMKFNISFIYSDWCMCCYHYVLHLINQYNLVPLMYPVAKKNKKLFNADLCWFNKSIGKNPEQEQAVVNILNMAAYPAPYILFGPPGTGKTATLVELICQIWKQGTAKGILVCASSNAAVDEITTRLLKYVPSIDIHRMYSRSKKRNDVPSTIQPCANFVMDENIFLPKDILLLKRIVLVSLTTCTRLLTAKFRENHFSYIIIDEASQAIEPEALIPLMLACTKDEENKGTLQAQVVIAGDHRQLGPFVQSKLVQPLLGKSMLERLMDYPLYKRGEENQYDPRYVTKLIRNYRTHECILRLPNKEFYDNELIPSGGVETTAAIGWSGLPNKKFPLIFHAVEGKEEKEKGSLSICNFEEISITMYYLKSLLDKKLGPLRVEPKHIGIITPFKLQQIKIKKELDKKGWENIDVGTVELFQGREKEIIILTTVRSRLFVHDGIEHIGFLSNEKRFNVAITRAKALLIVIGNPSVLYTDKYWGLLIQYCIQNKAYVGSSSTLAQLSAKQELFDKLAKGYVPNLHKGVDNPIVVEETKDIKNN